MELLTFEQFKDFELLDTGDGNRLERWGKVVLVRPDPQIIWERHLPASEWEKADAVFISREEKGRWNVKGKIPASWAVEWQDGIKFLARLTPFKHTGVFAEQAANWEWMMGKMSNSQYPISNADTKKEKPRILNLFGYTGAASVVLAKMGCMVTHVDASKPSIGLAKENQSLNNLPSDSIRWILDDAAKFALRELKRGQKYDGIIMDPPAFGHSPDGKTWKFNRDLPGLLETCVQLLSDDAKFLLVNGYATNSSAISLQNLLEDTIKNKKGLVESGELCLKQKDGRMISTGIFARWFRE